jgi:hypothetical protein
MPDKPYILGIDPANEKSAYCFVAPDLKPIEFDKLPNAEMVERCLKILADMPEATPTAIVIEGIENFGMPAGKTLFETAEFIGYCRRAFEGLAGVHKIYRHEEKMTICHNPRANDATIKQALIDRFAPNTSNYGKGSKKQKGFFYGFSADVWSGFAITVTYHDKYLEGMQNE